MKLRSASSAQRGSALAVVLILCMGMLMVVASVLTYSLSERRLNYREAMRIEARNAAEAISEYGLAQVRAKMQKRSDFSPTRFTTGQDANSIQMPSTTFWGGTNVSLATGFAPELTIGLVTPVMQGTNALYYFDPNDPANDHDVLKGRYAFRFDIKIISKATVNPPSKAAGAPHTVYMTQTLSARASPLFSHAIFYNMDLELWPGPAMTILGGVHTNGNLYVKKQSSSGLALYFNGPVTAAGSLIAGAKVSVMNYNGTYDDLSSYTDQVNFLSSAGSPVNLKGPAPNTTSPVFWRDHKWGTASENATTREKFRVWASGATAGNLQTSAHDVSVALLPGINSYVEDTTPYNGVDNSVNDSRKMIEPPLLSTDAGYSAEVEAQKYSTRSGLYIAVNPTSTTRNGRTPTGVVIAVPAGKYRAFMMATSNNTTTSTEVILPGQPDYGNNNTMINLGLNTPALVAAAGVSPLITIRNDEMYDMRRATGLDGAPFNWGAARSASNPFTPKNIDMIDVDMRTLKLVVDRSINLLTTSSVYRTATPADGTSTSNAAWTRFIYNAGATREDVTTTPLMSITNFVASNWNGAIYIQSIDAETTKTSGVRLINGRGPVASASDGSGLTIATNDALYILGHYNADGTINSSTTGTTNSGRFPESSSEAPCSIACDAITILSTPRYTNGGTSGVISQDGGWNDALSRVRHSSNSYSSNWATTAISNSNYNDGDSASTDCWRVPYDKTSGTMNTNNTIKLGGNDTEISAAFLAGIVISNKDGNGQNSGGANNYPRFLEDFGTLSNPAKTVAIRGSIVAMFESRAATEPWLWRTFNAPQRLWGFHELFRNGRFPPLTPRTMSYRRVDFNDISKATYDAQKGAWGLTP